MKSSPASSPSDCSQVAPAAAPARATHVGSNGAAPGARPPCPSLQIHNLSKAFGKVQVLDDVSFEVMSGEFVTLLGPSGCGKTTLLRIIAGLETPDEGQVLLHGANINGLPANRRLVNTVFQNYALFPHLRAYDNIAFGLRARRFPADRVRRRVHDAVALLQLGDLLQRYPHQLSGGQQQRVALARALVNEPEVLLLDEPMSALDAKLRLELQVELRRLQRQLGKTFILVTHDQDEAMTVSDRIMVMHGGTIEQAGAPSDVYERPVSRFVAGFLGSANLIRARRNGHADPCAVETDFGPLTLRYVPQWQEGTLAIRPERVRLCAMPPEINGFQVRVRDSVYRGDHIDLWVEPGGLRLRTPPSASVTREDTIWVQLPPENLEMLVD